MVVHVLLHQHHVDGGARAQPVRVPQRRARLQLLPAEDQPLLVRLDGLLGLDLVPQLVQRVARRQGDADGLAVQQVGDQHLVGPLRRLALARRFRRGRCLRHAGLDGLGLADVLERPPAVLPVPVAQVLLAVAAGDHRAGALPFLVVVLLLLPRVELEELRRLAVRPLVAAVRLLHQAHPEQRLVRQLGVRVHEALQVADDVLLVLVAVDGQQPAAAARLARRLRVLHGLQVSVCRQTHAALQGVAAGAGEAALRGCRPLLFIAVTG
mmetsp:Transcript_25481/g.41451  ORF Transcript_25481/g.41451 Transcript_25481/m.41451 type:complete len:267 (+) Transcript_25481:1101-1901(+)